MALLERDGSLLWLLVHSFWDIVAPFVGHSWDVTASAFAGACT